LYAWQWCFSSCLHLQLSIPVKECMASFTQHDQISQALASEALIGPMVDIELVTLVTDHTAIACEVERTLSACQPFWRLEIVGIGQCLEFGDALGSGYLPSWLFRWSLYQALRPFLLSLERRAGFTHRRKLVATFAKREDTEQLVTLLTLLAATAAPTYEMFHACTSRGKSEGQ
jgi:hypothetical protein